MGNQAREILIYGLLVPFDVDDIETFQMLEEKAEELGLAIAIHGDTTRDSIYNVAVGNVMPSINESDRPDNCNSKEFTYVEMMEKVLGLQQEMQKMNDLDENEKLLLLNQIIQVFNAADIAYDFEDSNFAYEPKHLLFHVTMEIQED